MNSCQNVIDELAHTDKVMAKRALKRVAIMTTVLVAANVAVHIIEKKMS